MMVQAGGELGIAGDTFVPSWLANGKEEGRLWPPGEGTISPGPGDVW